MTSIGKTNHDDILDLSSFHISKEEKNDNNNDNDRLMTLSIGPQHPGAGHMRIIIVIDGDIIVNADPDVGYVHRGEEKMSEYRTWMQNVPHTERPVIHDSSNILFAYCLAVEELLDVKIPLRGQYIRIIMAELDRINYTLYWLAILGIFLGHSTMFMWPTKDREFFIDLADMISGERITHAWVVPGGVRGDIPDDFLSKAPKFLDYFEKRLGEYDKIFFDNPLYRQRSENVGILRKNDAIDLGTTGSVIRASGVNRDVRKVEPYGIYDQLNFNVNTMKSGDSFARSILPIYDIKESIKIIRQCIKDLPYGEIKAKLNPNFKAKEGESFSRVEAGRGELNHYIVSNGSQKAYRHSISPPSLKNLLALPSLLKGARLADLPLIYWSLNIWPIEIER